MLVIALAMPALCASQVKKINSPKFHLPISWEVNEKDRKSGGERARIKW
jgi:hypothetical protein